MSEEIVVFSVTAGFGHNTRKPFVQVLIEAADWSTQMPPATARELAMNLLQAAEAAESDGFLVTFLRNQVGAEDRAIAGVLSEFREWREKERSQL